MKTGLQLPFVFLLIMSGCLDLDDQLFKQSKLSSYELPAAVIPESSRTHVVMQSQGKAIHGFFVRSSGVYPDQVVMYNQGNRDHLQYYWNRAEYFYTMGFNVFIYDYQGYGMSDGEPSEQGLYADAAAAYDYVHSLGFADSAISVYGYSLGGVAAIHQASSIFTPRRLIVESAFASTSALSQSGTLLDIPSSYIMDGEYPNAEKIRLVHIPVLVLHGIDDKFIDLSTNGKIIFDNANLPKQFIQVPGAGHSDVPMVMGVERYISVIRQFIIQ
jgi:fermentation-respiration switch protein FrsA (DUF1100 family)